MGMFIELLSTLVQTFTITWFITKFFGCKYSGWVRNFGFLLFWMLAFFEVSFLNFIVLYEGFLAGITIITFMLYACLFLNGSLQMKAFVPIFVYSIIFTMSSIFLFIGVSWADTSIANFALKMSKIRLFLLFALRITEYFIFKFVLRVNNQYSLTTKEWMLFIVIPLTSWSMMTVLTGAAVKSEIILPYILRVSLLMILINLIIYFFMIKIKKDSETRLSYELLQMEYNNVRSTEANMKALYESTCSLRHDLDKHFFAVKEMAKNNHCEDITDYIERIIDMENESIQKIVFTENNIFNAIVNAKLELCKQNDITSNIRIDKEAVALLNTETIVVVLGNAFDNAIEAAKNAENKIINFFVKLKRDYISLYIENSFDKKYSDISLNTTKQNPQLHGFGVKNIRKAVELNGGMTDFYIGENDMFCCDILLKK